MYPGSQEPQEVSAKWMMHILKGTHPPLNSPRHLSAGLVEGCHGKGILRGKEKEWGGDRRVRRHVKKRGDAFTC